MNSHLKQLGKNLPVVQRLLRERDALAAENARLQVELLKYGKSFPPGHFHSPIPNLDVVRADERRLFEIPETVKGIDLRAAEQMTRLESFVPYYETMPFQAEPQPHLRYYFENPAYSYSDAICLYCIIRALQPRRIIEAGSGFSSAVMLDTAEHFVMYPVEFTFIDPDTSRLEQLMRPTDRACQVVQDLLENTPLERFQRLAANDILFIDSTHVAKIGSDVNFLFFEILPALPLGVYVHVHDIFYPFEYPKDWIYKGRAWNEAYMLRTFLEFNPHFEIVLFNTYMEHFFTDWFAEYMPLCLKNTGGSIWLKRV